MQPGPDTAVSVIANIALITRLTKYLLCLVRCLVSSDDDQVDFFQPYGLSEVNLNVGRFEKSTSGHC